MPLVCRFWTRGAFKAALPSSRIMLSTYAITTPDEGIPGIEISLDQVVGPNAAPGGHRLTQNAAACRA
ncbi:hypothetical protein CC1G_15187 [Coprinopsis cinerea okayama7|uniref:Uncharacterized protein n=1 Tax=Coprinopsis cinerea (strain Okayama-7 / 130 / ATCC MYA-4618 / FGSC 9003) TaxID=240176 RepID=D6RPN6_COPC7|nr:hypothetical protein CC1G_15187 [Coprinopsis cinerea okayama7\|eukprot:XP_002910550.1 hypothetical protein CC1G_15187 [Coprinopsis cinerea okayama7\